MSREHRLTRRRMLRGIGLGALGASAGLPFLASLVARAGGSVPRKRLVVFCSPNEPLGKKYWAPGTAPFEGDCADNVTDVHADIDTTFDLEHLPAMMSPLLPHISKLVMLGNVHMESTIADGYSGHSGMAHVLVGRLMDRSTGSNLGGGISVDQHVAQALQVAPLNLGVKLAPPADNSVLSYLGPSQPVAPIPDPLTAFETLFADAALPPNELAALRAQRLSVLDRVSGDLAAIKAQLPAEGREKLEIHAQMVRSLEAQFEADRFYDCDPAAPPRADYLSNALFPVAGRRAIDVAVQALGCGLTDVATIQLSGDGGNNLTPDWPDEGVEAGGLSYHVLAHNWRNCDTTVYSAAELYAHRVAVERFFFSQFAYLLEQLDAVPEGTGTLLDSSLVLWVKPMSKSHRYTACLFMLAGSARGALSTGRYVGCGTRPHNDVLVSVCNLMGLPDETFGDPDFCTGALLL